MGEWPYAKEPFDTKLFVLLFVKKIGWILLVAFLGALLVGGGYYLKKVTFGGPKQYDITTTYYIDYAHQNPENGELQDYVNDATWKSWVSSDWFVDKAWQFVQETGFDMGKYQIQKEDLKVFFGADLPSDIRIPTSTVTTPYMEVTVALNEALQKTFFAFEEDHDEMSAIKIIDETEVTVARRDVRLVKAIMLGFVLGALAASFAVACTIIWDDTIILPETFTYRYGVPMAGYRSKGEQEWDACTEVKLQHLVKDKETVIMPIENLSKHDYDKLCKAEAVILVVQAGKDHGKAIEYVLHELKVLNCPIMAALLTGVDEKLIRMYRFGRKGVTEKVTE